MPNFDLKLLTGVRGIQRFYQLTIDDNPVILVTDTLEQQNEKKIGVLDQYEKQLEEKYKPDLEKIYAYMDVIANNGSLPATKFRELKRPGSDKDKDFEFKSGDLRVYAIKGEGSKIIVLCGYKNKQKKDINKMRSLKKQYVQSLKQSKK
jgi:uridine kinase